MPTLYIYGNLYKIRYKSNAYFLISYSLIKYVFVAVILFAGSQMSDGEKLKCTFKHESYWSWGSQYTCKVTDLVNENNDKCMTGFIEENSVCLNTNDVKMIHISGTNAKYIPSNLGDLFDLTCLYIGNSQLLAIKTEDFNGMENLKRLELGWNQLTKVPADAFAKLPKLEYLSLFVNHIEMLDASIFSNNGNLKEVWLTHNRLKFLGNGMFNGLTKLEKMDLGNNYCVSKTYTDLSNLQYDMGVMCNESPATTANDLTDFVDERIGSNEGVIKVTKEYEAKLLEVKQKWSDCEEKNQHEHHEHHGHNGHNGHNGHHGHHGHNGHHGDSSEEQQMF